MRDAISAIPALVEQLYDVVQQLEDHFPGRRFTPDGHLVGSIGEVLAAHHYGLELHTASTETHDACCPDGRNIQIKATQGSQVGIRSEPDYLLVLKLYPDGSFSEEFNGPGGLAWSSAGKMQSNGQRSISLFRLRKLMQEVSSEARIKRRA